MGSSTFDILCDQHLKTIMDRLLDHVGFRRLGRVDDENRRTLAGPIQCLIKKYFCHTGQSPITTEGYGELRDI